jgi:hypothetical protein
MDKMKKEIMEEVVIRLLPIHSKLEIFSDLALKQEHENNNFSIQMLNSKQYFKNHICCNKLEKLTNK